MKRINFKEIIIPVLVIGVLVVIAFATSRPKSTIPEAPSSEISLPEGWSISSQDSPDFSLKLEKKAKDSLLRPTIVLIESEAEFENEQDYVDSLIAGAKRTIPSLKLNSEKKEANGFAAWNLSGFYYTGGDRIEIIQRLYLKDNKVYSLTASFLADDQIVDEINAIYQEIFEKRIKPF